MLKHLVQLLNALGNPNSVGCVLNREATTAIINIIRDNYGEKHALLVQSSFEFGRNGQFKMVIREVGNELNDALTNIELRNDGK